ncbi:MAG: class I SAM-dependent methyltransferase [Pseudomonadota bacterium]
MSFTADWLALREPADHEARDRQLLLRAVRAAGPSPVILDLGCGTGSTVRAMRRHLPDQTEWRLVDENVDLMSLASCETGPIGQTYATNLKDLRNLPLDGVTLVTASALLDLMPEYWVRDLAALLAVPFYAALSYDGRMSWDPADPRDERVTAAFNAHQRGDKGLGPALGPDAASKSVDLFAGAGFETIQADSPWQLGPEAVPLHVALLEGIAEASTSAGMEEAAVWGADRIAQAPVTTCNIAHSDILALPPRAATEGRHAAD